LKLPVRRVKTAFIVANYTPPLRGIRPHACALGGAAFSGHPAILEQMTSKLPDDPVLKRLRAALNEIYGGPLDRVVLYGLHARGETHKPSF
jgi:hypothetical protein